MNTSQFQTDTSDGSSGLVAAFLCNKGLYAAMLSHHNLFRTMSKNRPTNAMVESDNSASAFLLLRVVSDYLDDFFLQQNFLSTGFA